MLQQINLYQRFAKTKKLIFSLELILILYALFLAVLLIDSAMVFVTNQNKKKQVSVLNEQLKVARQEVEDIKAKYPIIDVNSTEESMRQLRKDLLTKGKMLAIISRQTLFSSYLTAIANSIVSGAWLVEINIADAGQTLTLKGYVTQTISAQNFIASLKRQPIFKVMAFELDDLAVSTENPGKNSYFSFIITGKTDEL